MSMSTALGPPQSSRPPEYGRLLVLNYVGMHPTHCYLESGGQAAYMETLPKAPHWNENHNLCLFAEGIHDAICKHFSKFAANNRL